MFRTVVVAAFAVPLALVVGRAAHPQLAVASCPSGEQTLFQWERSDATGGKQYGSAVREMFDVRDRDLSTTCPGPVAWSTTQLGDPSAARQVEVGWVEELVSGEKEWRVFAEAQNGATQFGDFNDGPILATNSIIEAPYGFKVEFSGGYFIQYYTPNFPGGSWIEVGDILASQVGFGSSGWSPKGETGRLGGDGTGAADDHYDMIYATGCATSCAWTNWNGNFTPSGQNTIDNWSADELSETEYDAEKTS